MSMTAAVTPEAIPEDMIQDMEPTREAILGEATMRLREMIRKGNKTVSPADVDNFVNELAFDFKMKVEEMPRFCTWYKKEAVRRQKHSKEHNMHFVTQHLINSIEHCLELGDQQMDR